MIRGKKFVVGSDLNYTPSASVAMASSFEVRAVIRYEVITSIKQSGMHKLATTPCSAALFPNIAFCVQ